MKKVFALAFAAAVIGFSSCGPSAAEKKADSLNVASMKKSMNNDADSMIALMNAQNAASDSTAKAAAAAQKADSAKKADSMKNAGKKKK